MLPRQYNLFETVYIPPDTRLSANLAAIITIFTREDLLHPIALDYLVRFGNRNSPAITGLFGWSSTPIFSTYWSRLEMLHRSWTADDTLFWKDFHPTPALEKRFEAFTSDRDYPGARQAVLATKNAVPWNLLERLHLKHDISLNNHLQALATKQSQAGEPINYDTFFRQRGFTGLESFIARYTAQ